VIVTALLVACSAADPVVGSPPDASDPDPAFTPDEKAALAQLHYDGAAPPADPSNAYSDLPAARTFGQRLFFDPSLSGPLLEGDNDGGSSTLGKVGEAGKVSCAGCHVPKARFIDDRSPHRQISLAAQWTHRRSPTLLEIAFMPLYNWDGRRDALWNQAMGVMESDREFNASRLFVAEQIFRLHRSEYEAIFGALPPLDTAPRFPQLAPADAGCKLKSGKSVDCRGVPGDPAYDAMSPADQTAVTTVTVNVGKAIAAYLRLLRCGPSRFDAWLDGDPNALTRAEQRGAALFVGKARCASCHGGPRLTDGKFHNVGLQPGTVAVAFIDDDDRGAAEGLALALTDPLSSQGAFSDGDRKTLPAAVTPEHEGAFRTPTLRCIGKQPSFMHTAQLTSLEQVVAFFSRGGDPPGGYPGKSELVRLGLDERERADLVAFVGALDGAGPASGLLEAPK
jgi:cytochrome c peroxidase